jgi:predicted ATPase
MKARAFRLAGIRCFKDTHLVGLSAKCNLFVGQNNVGKSTILKSFLDLQGHPFVFPEDARKGSHKIFSQILIQDITERIPVNNRFVDHHNFDFVIKERGEWPSESIPGFARLERQRGENVFSTARPTHVFVPFLARRKTQAFNQDVSRQAQDSVNGNLSNLYSRIDLLATAGHPKHDAYRKAVEQIIGITITTKASVNGKEAGHYIDDDTFVTLDRMGDGVTEMVALIVELSLERDRIFILEEPETNLHPRGLKSLLALIRDASEFNQFIIATHSNIVVRELGSDPDNKIFQVSREDEGLLSPSVVAEVSNHPVSRLAVLRELGYEFSDMELHAAWLFLEESSAEKIIENILIPFFAPHLAGRLRTFSAGGSANVEASVAEFQRLVVFLHLQPIYQSQLWIRVDGDDGGKNIAASLRKTFNYLTDQTCASFLHPAFEYYYPTEFRKRAMEILAGTDRQAKRNAKTELLLEVLAWTKANPDQSKEVWAECATEVIDLLKTIEGAIGSR